MHTSSGFHGLVKFAVVVFCAVCLTLWLLCRNYYLPALTRPSTVSAAVMGNLDLIKSLQSSGMSLNHQDPRKFMWTPLIASIYSNQSNVFAYLITQGVDTEIRDAQGKSALRWAVDTATKTNLYFVEMLVSVGANTNSVDNHGRTIIDAVLSNPQRDAILSKLSLKQ